MAASRAKKLLPGRRRAPEPSALSLCKRCAQCNSLVGASVGMETHGLTVKEQEIGRHCGTTEIRLKRDSLPEEFQKSCRLMVSGPCRLARQVKELES